MDGKLNGLPGLPEVIPCKLDLLTERLLPGGVMSGQQILMSGEPGAGKSTFILQAVHGFLESGVGVIYVTAEQKRAEIEERFNALGLPKKDAHFQIHALKDLKSVSDMIIHSKGRSLYKVLVVDSIQGLGLNSFMYQQWQQLYALMEFLRLQGVASFFIAHTTKDSKIAGPKKLEHEVDSVMTIRRAFAYRLLNVSKNRFGPSTAEPVVCTVDRLGRIFPAQRSPNIIVAKSSGFDGHGLVEVESKVEFNFDPRSRRPALNGVTGAGYKKVSSILRGMGVDIGGFGNNVTCSLPGGNRYRPEHDLAIAMSLLSSYLQLPLRDDPIFCGELGLDGELRFLTGDILQRLVTMIDKDLVLLRSRAIVLERDSAMVLKSMLDTLGKHSSIRIVRATTLSNVASHFLLSDAPPEIEPDLVEGP